MKRDFWAFGSPGFAMFALACVAMGALLAGWFE